MILNADASRLLSGANFAQLGTLNADGSPHIDTVWFMRDDDLLLIPTTLRTRKARNLSRDARGFVVVTRREDPHEQLQMRVACVALAPDEDLAVCDRIAERYIGRAFPRRHHRGRVALHLRILSARHHIVRL